ncbi:MAG TPA: hypothetical protein VFW78_07335, partial [Bacteroidia bacterium]|nr:hypothetical protein [Bacteroidia bacterium]
NFLDFEMKTRRKQTKPKSKLKEKSDTSGLKSNREKQPNRVHYTFMDWEAGLISTSMFKHAGESPTINIKTGETTIYSISQSDFIKIQEEAKERFYQKVQQELINSQQYFERMLNRSEDQERLINQEIEGLEILFKIREGTYENNMLYYQHEFGRLYKKHKVKGLTYDYSLTESPNCGFNVGRDGQQVYFEASWLYWKWLLEIKNNKLENSSSVKGLSLSEIALMQVFIHDYENGHPINNSNAHAFLKGTNFKSTRKLIEHFNRFQKTNERVNAGRYDKRSFRIHCLRYQHIIPLLELNYPKAAAAANDEFLELPQEE